MTHLGEKRFAQAISEQIYTFIHFDNYLKIPLLFK